MIAKLDDEIDRVDVEIERASIPLLAMGPKEEYDIRSVLTIVKVNNELERVADCAVNIAEVVLHQEKSNERIPDTFHVMANSVIGMLRDANRSLAKSNPTLAQQVLLFDDTVAGFKEKILLDAQEKVAKGQFTVKFAFRLLAVTKAFERIADHCTNISEQGHLSRERPHRATQARGLERPDITRCLSPRRDRFRINRRTRKRVATSLRRRGPRPRLPLLARAQRGTTGGALRSAREHRSR
jgi:phosphate transport system protein